jgi:hypothetical protein
MSTPPPPSSPPSAQRSDAGAVLLGLGALLLFISLFLHWYRPGASAWAVFEVWDLVLAGLALAAFLAAVGRLGLARERTEHWMTVPSAAAFVIVVSSLLNHPPAAAGEGPMIGIWLALFASILMLAGVATSMARISLVIERTERSHGARSAPGVGLGRLRRRAGAKRPTGGASASSTGAQPPSSPRSPSPPGGSSSPSPGAPGGSSSPSPGPPGGSSSPSPPVSGPPGPASSRTAAPESPLFPTEPDEPEPPRSIQRRGASDPAEAPTQSHTHGDLADKPAPPAERVTPGTHAPTPADEPGDPSDAPAPDGS